MASHIWLPTANQAVSNLNFELDPSNVSLSLIGKHVPMYSYKDSVHTFCFCRLKRCTVLRFETVVLKRAAIPMNSQYALSTKEYVSKVDDSSLPRWRPWTCNGDRGVYKIGTHERSHATAVAINTIEEA